MARNFRSLLLVVLLANNLSKIVATFLYLLLLLLYSIFLYITTCVTHREVAQFFCKARGLAFGIIAKCDWFCM